MEKLKAEAARKHLHIA